MNSLIRHVCLVVSVILKLGHSIELLVGRVELPEIIYQGKIEENQRKTSFYGIQYAEQPVGERRFEYSELYVPTFQNINSTENNNIKPVKYVDDPSKIIGCPQRFSEFGVWPSNRPFFTRYYKENCLSLNIFVPRIQQDEFQDDATQNLLPVLLFVHGGAYRVGYDRTYGDGELLTDQGIIVVSINYRLGYLGFLSHSNATYNLPGNYGVSDIITGLKWLHENIEYFRGDKDNITLMGQSAGAQMIQVIVANNLADDLFRRAILHSGPLLPYESRKNSDLQVEDFIEKYCEIGNSETSESIETSGNTISDLFNFGRKIKSSETTQESLKSCLQKLSLRQIRTMQILKSSFPSSFNQLAVMAMEPFTPVMDPDFGLNFQVLENFANTTKELIIGNTLDEIEFSLALAFNSYYYKLAIHGIFKPDIAEKILEKFPPICDQKWYHKSSIYAPSEACDHRGLINRILSALMWECPARKMSKFRKGETFYYNFNNNKLELLSELATKLFSRCQDYSCHGSDLSYVMSDQEFLQDRDMDLDLSRNMVQFWSNFIKYGGKKLKELGWQAYNNQTQNIQNFVGNNPSKNTDSFHKNIENDCQFWDDLDIYETWVGGNI